MLQMYKDLKDVQRKQRYLDAMESIGKVVKDALDKKPTPVLEQMARDLKEIMIYNTKLEMELDDLKFADSIRVGRMRRLVETVEYYEKKVELLEKKI